MSDIGITCRICGRLFVGNKCPHCGWEVLNEKIKKMK